MRYIKNIGGCSLAEIQPEIVSIYRGHQVGEIAYCFSGFYFNCNYGFAAGMRLENGYFRGGMVAEIIGDTSDINRRTKRQGNGDCMATVSKGNNIGQIFVIEGKKHIVK